MHRLVPISPSYTYWRRTVFLVVAVVAGCFSLSLFSCRLFCFHSNGQYCTPNGTNRHYRNEPTCMVMLRRPSIGSGRWHRVLSDKISAWIKRFFAPNGRMVFCILVFVFWFCGRCLAAELWITFWRSCSRSLTGHTDISACEAYQRYF